MTANSLDLTDRLPQPGIDRESELILRLTSGSQASAQAAASAAAESLSGQFDAPVAVLSKGMSDWLILAGQLELSGHVLCEGGGALTDGKLTWVERGAVAVVVGGDVSVQDGVLESVAVWVDLHRRIDLASDSARDSLHEAGVLRAVTEQLRSAPDLDEVLHSIAWRTLDLLEADICGVLLRENDLLRMRSCVGNRAAETARLTMRCGQGVAGLVFATGKVERVDDYLADRTISQDFMSLASREGTRSALAVPLTIGGDLIGVLEVWRRRASIFSDRDVQRMLSLADFATIAINNARLYAEQDQTLGELQSTREALEREVQFSRRLASLQACLIDAILKRPTLAALAEVVADEIDCAVGIYGPEGQLIAAQPDLEGHAPPGFVELHHGAQPPSCGQDSSTVAMLRPVVIEGERLGGVLLLGREPVPGLLDVECGQVALAISLAHLHERSASRARAEALEQAMWDLLSGPIESRMAARSRTQQMGINLTGPHLVLHGSIDNLGTVMADPSSWDRASGEILRALRSCESTPRHTLMSVRGEHLAVVMPAPGAFDVRAVVGAWSAAASDVVPDVSFTWGVSRVHGDAFALATGFEEAKVALMAAQRLGARNVAIYDELGIVRLLLGSGSNPDLHSFIEEVTGPLMAYDDAHDGSLVLTLRTYFDANCSQKVAAERLFIHHKTMSYRLKRIRQLTGLDLKQHEDRMRADFALRILQVNDPDPAGQMVDWT